MDSNELLSSRILSDVKIIADIYKIVKAAGLKTTELKRVIDFENDLCVIKPYQPGKTRYTTECVLTKKYSIKYNANDIMIVGGSALNIYDYKLQTFKERHGLNTLEAYIKKKTSDIDIVWWPRPSTDREIIISTSKAIIEVVNVFKEELQRGFNDASKDLEGKIKPYITNALSVDELKIYVNSFETRPAGVFNINITFQIKEKILKICDIAIHDSGAAQRYDPDGKEITDLRFMTHDPIYSNPTPGQVNSITYLDINGIDIAVPNIVLFVKQQMLAFDNLVRLKELKGFINYKRVEFIKQLLGSFNLNNKKNSSDLLEVFGTDSRAYPSEIIRVINRRVSESITKIHTQILNLCKTINISTDTIIGKLCEAAETVQLNLLIEIERQKLIKKQKEKHNTSHGTPPSYHFINDLTGEEIIYDFNTKLWHFRDPKWYYLHDYRGFPYYLPQYPPLTSGNAPLTSGNAPLTSGNAPLTSGNAPLTSGNAPLTSGNALLTSGNAPLTSGKNKNTKTRKNRNRDNMK